MQGAITSRSSRIFSHATNQQASDFKILIALSLFRFRYSIYICVSERLIYIRWTHFFGGYWCLFLQECRGKTHDDYIPSMRKCGGSPCTREGHPTIVDAGRDNGNGSAQFRMEYTPTVVPSVKDVRRRTGSPFSGFYIPHVYSIIPKSEGGYVHVRIHRI